jgi:ABC-2 type transport system permease protein
LFFRDRVTVALTVLLPLLLSVFFALMFASTTGAAVKIALVNQDGGKPAQAIVKSFVDLGASNDLTITARPEKEAMDALDNGDVDLVMVMPAGLSEAIAAKRPYSMRASYDSAKSETAHVASLVADNAVARLNLGLAQAPSGVTLQSVDRSAGQPSLAEYYVPNFLAISILWLSIFATALPLVKQRQDKALLRIGIAPVSKATFMGAITLWRITVGIAQVFNFAFTFLFISGGCGARYMSPGVPLADPAGPAGPDR